VQTTVGSNHSLGGTQPAWHRPHDPRTFPHDSPVQSGPSSGVVRTWPLLVLALPAAVAVWSGWVGIGQMTGFGIVQPLPGIWNSLRIDTAVTLPVGVEAYAAMALRTWLASSQVVSARTRKFASRSAIGSLALGARGQVAYHLLAEFHITPAPWPVTTLVASLPVVVLGPGTALAHMLRADAITAAQRAGRTDQLRTSEGPVVPGPDAGDPTAADQFHGEDVSAAGTDAWAARIAEARATAKTLVTAGNRVSRRTLRSAGVRGSNAELGKLAQRIRADLQGSGPESGIAT
jgi:hypothetical protein